jgi:hypothetical protein
MKTEIRTQLSDILDRRQRQKDAATSRAAEQQTVEGKNLADFSVAKEKVIKPAFQEIVELYKLKGLRAEIIEQNEHGDDRSGWTNASIELDLAQTEDFGATLKPHFKFIFDKRKRTLLLHISTRSSAGSAGSPVALDSLDADWIQNAFVNYASK